MTTPLDHAAANKFANECAQQNFSYPRLDNLAACHLSLIEKARAYFIARSNEAENHRATSYPFNSREVQREHHRLAPQFVETTRQAEDALWEIVKIDAK